VRGQNVLNLDIGLPVQNLRIDIRACLAGERDFAETTLAATNRRGKKMACKVTITPLIDVNKEIRGAIVIMDEQIPQVTH
jgi:two-component system, chemotaxis family, CheB/CheR fusion protein